MSDLITPNLNGMSERQFRKRGAMNVTHDELAEQLKALAQAMLAAFGPIAQLQLELMARQSAMEDALRNGTPLEPFEVSADGASNATVESADAIPASGDTAGAGSITPVEPAV